VRRRRTAFTLIELLAASALAALLMLVLFQVIGSLGRTRAAMVAAQTRGGRAASHAAWTSDLLDTLRRDLANATEARIDDGGGRLEITGHGSLDRDTLAAAQEPVTAVYELAATAPGHAHLVRRQSPRGGLSGQRAWSELLCANVSRFTVEPASAPAAVTVIRANPLSSPLRVRVVSDSGTLLLDEVIVIR
jgi:prepilin-type N-terminal cleavage/methylation domain-containing protein